MRREHHPAAGLPVTRKCGGTRLTLVPIRRCDDRNRRDKRLYETKLRRAPDTTPWRQQQADPLGLTQLPEQASLPPAINGAG